MERYVENMPEVPEAGVRSPDVGRDRDADVDADVDAEIDQIQI